MEKNEGTTTPFLQGHPVDREKDPDKMDSDPILEDIMGQIGEFGPYQLRQHLLHLLAAMLAGVHMLSLTFVAPTPNHRCFIEEIDGQNATGGNPLSHYIPFNDDGEPESCLRYDLSNNETVSCDKYHYDPKFYTSSKVIEWDLVCDKRWMQALMQSMYMLGVLIGGVLLGSLADVFGRKPIFYISGVLQLVFGLLCAFMPTYGLHSVALFLYGAFGSGGAYVAAFVLSMELIGASRRTICGIAFSFIFAVGAMLVALWGFVIENEQLLQIVLACHSLILIGHWWLIDESIRWLWGKGRFSEAIKIAEKALATNGKEFVNKEVANAHYIPANSEKKAGGFLDLFRHPTMRLRLLNVFYNWFANSLAYYGLYFSSTELDGNPYFLLFLNAVAEVPGYILVAALMDKTGRRSLSFALLMIGGLACLIIAFIPQGMLVITIAMVSKAAVAGSFALIYNYTVEIFPTLVRNSAIGICTMGARASGTLTPQIKLLDSVGESVPTIIFGTVAIVASILVLFLPETVNKNIPQTIEDGENFGKGDTAFKTLRRYWTNRNNRRESSRPSTTTITTTNSRWGMEQSS